MPRTHELLRKTRNNFEKTIFLPPPISDATTQMRLSQYVCCACEKWRPNQQAVMRATTTESPETRTTLRTSATHKHKIKRNTKEERQHTCRQTYAPHEPPSLVTSCALLCVGFKELRLRGAPPRNDLLILLISLCHLSHFISTPSLNTPPPMFGSLSHALDVLGACTAWLDGSPK